MGQGKSKSKKQYDSEEAVDEQPSKVTSTTVTVTTPVTNPVTSGALRSVVLPLDRSAHIR